MDIDIDFIDRDAALEVLDHIPASILTNHTLTRHNSGIYCQAIPRDPITGYANLPFREAEKAGYFKIDFLNNTIYEGVRDESHLASLCAREPPWELFENEDIVGLLPQIYNHFGIISKIKPQSINDLSLCLALIRPGKAHLLHQPRSIIEQEIWKPSVDGYAFKRSHGLAYAMSIIVRLNLLIEQ